MTHATTPVVLPLGHGPVDRLRRRRDFALVLRSGRRARRSLVAVAVRPNDWGRTRVGYAVGKRVGGAVVRNRVRRRLRALIHELLGPLAQERDHPPGEVVPMDIVPMDIVPMDIVITAFAEAVGAPFGALRRDLASALRATGVSGTSRAEPESTPGRAPGPASEPASRHGGASDAIDSSHSPDST
jgi:ribonuclease P protein component